MVSVVDCILSTEESIEELHKCLERYFKKIDGKLANLVPKSRLLYDYYRSIKTVVEKGDIDSEIYYNMLLKVEANILSCEEFKNFINAKEEVNG